MISNLLLHSVELTLPEPLEGAPASLANTLCPSEIGRWSRSRWFLQLHTRPPNLILKATQEVIFPLDLPSA